MADGLWAPQTPQEFGGMGIGLMGQAAMYEEANRSIFGPACFNAAAPDDGNMMVLAKAGTSAQQERWLLPIVRGEVRSAFVMTEPHPGGGSDPLDDPHAGGTAGDCYVVHGRKWFITGAEEAKHFILIARTVGRSAPRTDGVPLRPGPAGLAHRPAHPDHGAGGAWRALRTRFRRARDPAGCGAARGRARG